MKKTFAGIATTITILVIFISFAYNLMPPANGAPADTEEWQLTVTGLVGNPFNLSWADMVAMPNSSVNAALICVDAPATILEQGNWTGIKLRVLLEEAVPSSGAIKVGFFAADGYSTDLTLETAMRDDIILAYEKDGAPLNDLRLVVPGKWGYKWISQVTQIRLFDYDFLGFWESRGYSDVADTSAGSRGVVGDIPRLTKSNSTSSSSTPPPTASPSPLPSQPPITSPAPFDQSTPTPQPSEGFSLPTEVIYIIAVSAVAVVLVALLTFVRKRAK